MPSDPPVLRIQVQTHCKSAVPSVQERHCGIGTPLPTEARTSHVWKHQTQREGQASDRLKDRMMNNSIYSCFLKHGQDLFTFSKMVAMRAPSSTAACWQGHDLFAVLGTFFAAEREALAAQDGPRGRQKPGRRGTYIPQAVTQVCRVYEVFKTEHKACCMV